MQSREGVGAARASALMFFSMSLVLGCKSGDEAAAQRSRIRAEATRALGKLRNQTKDAFNTVGSYPAVTAPLTPATPCCQQPGKRCAPKASDWESEEWKALGFRIDEISDLQFSYTGDATSYNATAVGDPGCTGTPKTYLLVGQVTNGTPRFSLTIPPP